MNIKSALSDAAKQLSFSATANLDARVLLAHVLHYSQEQLLINYFSVLSQEETDQFFCMVNRRVLKEPIAYIIGVKEFFGLEFDVNQNVLIPRPETEMIVEETINICSITSMYAPKILDLGTGSGAIAISIAKNIKNAFITATDISVDALKLAKKNARKHNCMDQISFIQSNWLNNLEKEEYSFIVSNPPYIAISEKQIMSKETLEFEPEIALFAPENGLLAYRQIISNAKNFLAKDGKLLLEIGFSQKEAVSNILRNYGFVNINSRQDLKGHDRLLIAENCV